MTTIAERIKAARTAAALTQAQLADMLDISQAYLAQIETGRRKCSADLLAAICIQTGADPARLLLDTPGRPTKQ